MSVATDQPRLLAPPLNKSDEMSVGVPSSVVKRSGLTTSALGDSPDLPVPGGVQEHPYESTTSFILHYHSLF